jgi:chemotaxis protein CheY-P-specific phosphatase CheC
MKDPMGYLNEQERSAATRIVNLGLSKAAESFGSLIQGNVDLKSFDLQVVPREQLGSTTQKEGDDVHVLSTSIQGELKGSCFLVLSAEEAERFKEANLPEKVLADEDKKKEMGDAMLMEIDNIIAAAVLTRFADILGLDIKGGVPAMERLANSAVDAFMLEGVGAEQMVMNFNASFRFQDRSISPEFVWIMDEAFLERIRGFAQDPEKVQELHEADSAG